MARYLSWHTDVSPVQSRGVRGDEGPGGAEMGSEQGYISLVQLQSCAETYGVSAEFEGQVRVQRRGQSCRKGAVLGV